jgi:hypothetical protein
LGYRDEAEQLRARVRVLEQELHAAETKINGLERAKPAHVSGVARLLGAGTRSGAERQVDGTFDEPMAEEVVDRLRARFASLGQVSRLGNTLTFSTGPPATQRVVEFSVVSRGGRTTIRASENLANLAGGMFGGIVGGVGGGGLGLILPLTARLFGAGVLPVLAVGWILGVFLVVRSYFGRMAATRDRELDAAVGEIAEIIRRGSLSKARIDLASGSDGALDEEREAAEALESEAAEALEQEDARKPQQAARRRQ